MGRMSVSGRNGLGAAALVVVVLVGACGGSNTEGADESDSVPSPTQVETQGGTLTGEPVWFSDHLDVGDCWNEAFDADGEVDRSGVPEVLECSGPHFLEVFGAWSSEATEYPGEDALGDEATEVCNEGFLSYIGAEYSDVTALNYFVPKPTEEQWNDDGARRMVCVAYYNYGRITGSFEGIGTREPLPYDMPDDAPIPEEAEAWDVGDTEDGDRVISFSLQKPLDEAVELILTAAADAGWTTVFQGGTATVAQLVLSDADVEYTTMVLVIDDPEEVDIAFYYPPGPLSTYAG